MKKHETPVQIIQRLMTVAKVLAKNNQHQKPAPPQTADQPAKNTKRRS